MKKKPASEHYAVTADRARPPCGWTSSDRKDGALFAQPHPGRSRQRKHPRERQAAKSSYKVKPLDRIQIVMPHRGAIELSPKTFARNPLRGQMAAAGRQTGRSGRTSGRRQLQRHAGQCADVPPQQAGDPRQEQNRGDWCTASARTPGTAGHRQGRADPCPAGWQFFNHTINAATALVWGNFDEEEGTITGNIAAPAVGPARCSFRRRIRRQTP